MDKGKGVMAGEKCSCVMHSGEQVPQLAEDDDATTQWLHVLLRTMFWEPCARGHKEENKNRAEESVFCIHCRKAFCPHCTHGDTGHRLLKIRRYVYRSVVLAKEMQELNVDVSRIQTYVINGQKGVHLRPMRRSPLFRPPAGAPPCKTCGCWLRTAPNLFCSLTCKIKADVSQDDFSGPEAERRYRNCQPNMLNPQEVLTPEPDRRAEAEVLALEPAEVPSAVEPAEAAVNNPGPINGPMSFRMRPRKQPNPQRAPFS